MSNVSTKDPFDVPVFRFDALFKSNRRGFSCRFWGRDAEGRTEGKENSKTKRKKNRGKK